MLQWRLHLNSAAVQAHKRWLAGPRDSDQGRLDLEGLDLTGAILRHMGLNGLRLTRCDLTDANGRVSYFEGAEIRETIFDRAILQMAHFDGAVIERSRFHDAQLKGAHLRDAQLSGNDWTGAHLFRTSWHDASARGECLRTCDLSGAMLHGTHLVDCDLRGAKLLAAEPTGAVFERCDLRGADLSKLTLDGTVFRQCGFHGCTGTPDLAAPSQFIECDLSPEFDHSQIVSAETLLDEWQCAS